MIKLLTVMALVVAFMVPTHALGETFYTPEDPSTTYTPDESGLPYFEPDPVPIKTIVLGQSHTFTTQHYSTPDNFKISNWIEIPPNTPLSEYSRAEVLRSDHELNLSGTATPTETGKWKYFHAIFFGGNQRILFEYTLYVVNEITCDVNINGSLDFGDVQDYAKSDPKQILLTNTGTTLADIEIKGDHWKSDADKTKTIDSTATKYRGGGTIGSPADVTLADNPFAVPNDIHSTIEWSALHPNTPYAVDFVLDLRDTHPTQFVPSSQEIEIKIVC